jgi:hypothetical protein
LSENMPCPSCGSAEVEEFIPLPDKYPGFDAIICRKCGMRGPADTWNFRVPPPQLVYACAAIVRLREALHGLLMVSLPGDVSGQRHIDDAREALKATEDRPASQASGG